MLLHEQGRKEEGIALSNPGFGFAKADWVGGSRDGASVAGKCTIGRNVVTGHAKQKRMTTLIPSPNSGGAVG